MSHKRKDTGVAAPVWRKHLRPEWKRCYHKMERVHTRQVLSSEDSVNRGSPSPPKKKKYGLQYTENWIRWYKDERSRDQAYKYQVNQFTRAGIIPGGLRWYHVPPVKVER